MTAMTSRRPPATPAPRQSPPPSSAKPLWRRLLPVGILAACFVAFFALDLDRFASFEALRDHREVLRAFVSDQFLLAILIYVVIYAVMVAVSVPGATVFTVAGGFLFGSFAGTFAAVAAATFGATVIFLVAKTALGEALREKAGGRLERLLDGFRKDAFSYLLVLRLVPLFPFFVVNIAPAFASVSLRVYVFSTLLGIIPGTFVYAQVGVGLGSIFDSGEAFTLGSVLTPEIIIALIGLAVLSLIPVIYKKMKGAR